MQLAIAADPEAHPVVAGTGGVRKACWTRQGKGKSGGVRVIYYYWRTIEPNTARVLDPEVYLLSIYARNDRSDMTAADRKAARNLPLVAVCRQMFAARALIAYLHPGIRGHGDID